MDRINKLETVVGIVVGGGIIIALVVTHQLSALGSVGAAVGGLLALFLNARKAGGAS